MLPQLRAWGQRLRESLWFLPGLLVLGACALAYGLITFDTRTSFGGAQRFPLLFGAGAEGSRGMLTAIAGSMLTVAALVFSLTLSTISQVSSQYSPRVLRNFMRDRGNQVVMGYFVGVFAYCLLVLGTIRSVDERKFVPSTAVLGGLVLALGGVVALIYFIHHIAESLQTGTVLQRISRETSRAIDALFPQELGEPATTSAQPIARAGVALPLRATTTGYVQHFDADQLLHWAEAHGAVVRLTQPVGAFVGEQDELGQVLPDNAGGPAPSADALAKLRTGVGLAPHRSIEQDVAFGLQQLVDVALKALSPGINDPTTAIMAIDHLGLLLQRLAGRPFPAQLRVGSNGQPRVWVAAADFNGYLCLAFDLVRISGHSSHAVLIRMLQALARVADTANTTDRRRAVAAQAALIREVAEQALSSDYEKQAVRSVLTELSPRWEPGAAAPLDDVARVHTDQYPQPKAGMR